MIPRFATSFTSRGLNSHSISSRDTDSPLCEQSPEAWDLEVLGSNHAAALEAIRVCHTCPLFASCAAEVSRLESAGTPPMSLIWAGEAFTATGSRIAAANLGRSMRIAEKRRQRTDAEWEGRVSGLATASTTAPESAA